MKNKIIPIAGLVMAAFSAITDVQAKTLNLYSVDLPEAVRKVDAFFQEEKFNEMGLAIKDALISNPKDSTLTRTLLDYYDKAYDIKNDGAVSPDYRLPASISYLAFAVRRQIRTESNTISYVFDVWMEHEPGTNIESFKLTRNRDEVWIDQKAGDDYMTDELNKHTGKLELWAGSIKQSQPLPDGLYFFEIKLKGELPFDGWLLMSKLNSDASPTMVTPVENLEFTKPNPVFQWKNFISTERRSRPYEVRAVHASVTDANTGDNLFDFSPDGVAERLTVSEPLAKGNYHFRISYRERFKFGEIVLARRSETKVPFKIK